MRFSWNKKDSTNVFENYREITESLTKDFFQCLDSDLYNMHNYFTDQVLITFLNSEFIGYNTLYNEMSKDNIWKLKHSNLNCCGQPLDNNSILITVTGDVQVNGSFVKNSFTTTLVLNKDNSDNFMIENWIYVSI